MSTTDRAAEIRATLKAKKITSRQVSVRAHYFSMGSSIDVKINDANISLKMVEEIANAHESISRCELTGEILSGGNRYVHVQYSADACKALAARHLDAVTAAAAKITENYLIPVDGTPFLVGRGNYGLSVWSDGSHVANCYDVNEAAYVIGARMAGR